MRARNIKPGFFKNAELAELPFEGRLLFCGLWCLADREGRLQDRPKQIRGEIFPYDMGIDVDSLLNLLVPRFLIRYEANNQRFLQIQNFQKHQQPHYKENPSQIPAPPDHVDSLYLGGGVPESLRVEIISRTGKCMACGAKRDLTIDHIKPRSIGGTNEESNLQVLCRKCNASKNNRILESFNLEPTLTQDRLKVGSTKTLHDPLIPESPILNPESTTSAAPKVAAPVISINKNPKDIATALATSKAMNPAAKPDAPYKTPETPLQKFLVGIKILQGFDAEDREWDKTYFKRYGRAASDMLAFFGGNWQEALGCSEIIVKDLESKKLSWTVETLVKHAPHYRRQIA